MKRVQLLILIILAITVLISCSKASDLCPASPALTNEAAQTGQSGSGHYSLGMWFVSIDENTDELLPARTSNLHFNTVQMLENSPCQNCLNIENIEIGPDTLDVDVEITHPYPGLDNLTVFDVRGIIINQDTDTTFPTNGRQLAWKGETTSTVLNADGFTSLFNPTEFPETLPAMLGYIPGKFSTSEDLTANLSPYLAYNQDASRRIMAAGSTSTAHLTMSVSVWPIKFGYAVDVSWAPKTGNSGDPIKDFPLSANCPEAYKIEATAGFLGCNSENTTPIDVIISDHQGVDSIAEVTIESPELFDGEIPLNFAHTIDYERFLFKGLLPNNTGAAIGIYPLLVCVRDNQADNNLGQIDTYQVISINVVNPGWAKTWGGTGFDSAEFTALHDNGVYITGYFQNAVDFDPGFSEVWKNSVAGSNDVFLSSLDTQGNLIWNVVWGGSGLDDPIAIAANANSVFVVGSFQDTVDFDPGPGTDIHTAEGGWDAFVSKFNPDGSFQWTKTWNLSPSVTRALDIVIDKDDQAYVIWSNGDIHLTAFSPSGSTLWEKSWGGPGSDGYNCALVIDEPSTYLYVTGDFRETVDFDPSAGTSVHSSLGGEDIFLSKFDTTGEYLWTIIWGGTGEHMGPNAIACRDSVVYTTGYFDGSANFSGILEDPQISNGDLDIFVIANSADIGAKLWTKTIGGNGTDCGRGISLAPISWENAPISITGYFSNGVSFNPDGEKYTSSGWTDAFLLQLSLGGTFVSCTTWGGPSNDYSDSVLCSVPNSLYVSGYYSSTANLGIGLWGDDWRTSNGATDAFLIKLFQP